MAEIIAGDKTFEIVINKMANPVETIDKMGKEGYKAVIGFDPAQDKHVVMNVLYDKKKYTLNDVAAKLETLRNCGKCSTLDKEKMNLERITMQGDATGLQTPKPITAYDPSIVLNSAKQENEHKLPEPEVKIDIKNIFSDALFDAMFTRTGLYFLGTLTGDMKIMDKVMPRNEEEMNQMMEEMIDFLSGDADLFRSPDQAKEYLSLVRETKEAERTQRKNGFGKKNRRVENAGIIIC